MFYQSQLLPPTSHVVSCFQANILEVYMSIMTNSAIYVCRVCFIYYHF